VQCEEEHELDLAVHIEGMWNELPTGADWHPPDKEGYKHLTHATTRGSSDATRLSIKAKARERLLFLAGGEQTEIITASGLGTSPTQEVPVAIIRRRAQKTRYVWAVSLDGQEVKLNRTAGGVEVTAAGRAWKLAVDPASAKCQIEPAQ